MRNAFVLMVSERYGENERDMPWNSEGTETEACAALFLTIFARPLYAVYVVFYSFCM